MSCDAQKQARRRRRELPGEQGRAQSASDASSVRVSKFKMFLSAEN